MKTRSHGSQTITLRAVGDILFGPTPTPWNDKRFRSVARLLQSADVTFGNLECSLVERGLPRWKVDITRADLSKAGDLKRMGVQVVSLANNHMMDYDILGLRSTQQTLRKAGIAYAGAGTNIAQAFAPAFVNVGTRRVGIVACQVFYIAGFEDYTHGMCAGKDKPGIANMQVHEVRVPSDSLDGVNRTALAPEERSFKMLLRSIRKAKQRADFVIFSMHSHFRKDGCDVVAHTRRMIAREAVRAGADLILGHGPHAINGIECFEGVFIVHSMGNFFFDIAVDETYFIPEAKPFARLFHEHEKYWHGIVVEARLDGRNHPDELRLIPFEIPRKSRCAGLPRSPSRAVVQRIGRRLSEKSSGLGVAIAALPDGTFSARPQ